MKKRNKWYYTSAGKTLRGFLCLLTLALFTSCSIYLYYMYTDYGMYMFDTEKTPYVQTDCYNDDIKRAVDSVQTNTKEIAEATSKVVVYDTVYKSYIVKTSGTGGGESRRFSFDGETNVEVNQLYQKEMPFENFHWVKEELKKKQDGNVFVHFNKEGFKELFIKCGKQNTDQKFSEEFSEDCYFVFPNMDMIGNTDIYAVYDPEKDAYYSTFDQYFPAYSSYFYRFDEISGIIDMGDYEYDNIIFPLLRSYNYNMSYIMELFYRMSNESNTSIEWFQEKKEDAFTYCYSSSQLNGDWYANVSSKDDITALPKFFYLSADGTQDVGQANLAEELGVNEQSIVSNTSWWPSDMEFYFAMDYERTEKLLKENGNGNKKNLYYYYRYKNYNHGAKFFIPILILNVFMFVALCYLTLSLIKTTGRKSRKRDESEEKRKVYLNVFDKSPTEIYLLFVFAILFFWGVVCIAFFYEFTIRFQQYMAFALIGDAVVAFVYGLVFMLFALSLLRRIKARNLCNHLQIVRLFKWIIKKMVDYYRKHSGTQLFSSLFQIYMVIQAIIFLLALSVAIRQEAFYPYVIVVSLCVIPNIIAIIVVNKLLGDVTLITQCMDKIKEGDLEAKCGMDEGGHFLTEIAEGVDGMGEGIKRAVEQSIRDERMRTELITNVSHDLKTPLTSIINYVDLLKKEEMYSDTAKHYLEVLEQKSQRLKHLTEDLVEAAKANTGNIELNCMPLAFDELMRQAIGEFEDKYVTRNLTMISTFPEEPVIIMADGRRLFRIVENVLQNAYKYAMENTRVYADVLRKEDSVVFELKNISKAPLNISPEELMERFTRGDSSRSTEGSGLGLSIARDLTALMEGQFSIKLDGDLFKVVIEFSLYKEPEKEALIKEEVTKEESINAGLSLEKSQGEEVVMDETPLEEPQGREDREN